MRKTNFILFFVLISFMLMLLGLDTTITTAKSFALMLESGVEDLTNKADSIVIGEVTDVKSEWNQERTAIYTYVTILVKEWVKGQSTDNTITIKQLGGKVGNIGMEVSECAKYAKGEEVLIFLESDRIQKIGANKIGRVVNMHQGKYSVEKDKITGAKMLTVRGGVFATKEGKIVIKNGKRMLMEDFIGQIKQTIEAEKKK
jgi:hypothetical protein